MKRHRLGQHYLTDPTVVEAIVEEAAIETGERVFEIGTGRGTLTRRLAAVSSSLECYEVDPENYRETVALVTGDNVRVHLGDAFSSTPRFDVLVSSLPYSESTNFVEWISVVPYLRGIVVLQKDFVRKLLSFPGARDYRAISAIAQISSTVVELFDVPKRAFSPQPKVDSVVVRVEPRTRVSPAQISAVKRLFSLRRKTVTSALKELHFGPPVRDYGRRRVFSLVPREVLEICPRPE